MPVFNSRTVIDLARGMKAFLNLEAGLTRGEVPTSTHAGELARVRTRLEEKEQQVARLEHRLAALAPGAGGVEPENVVWIFCSNRSGSTWLSSMMGEIEGHEVWNEPLVGKLFGDLYYTGAAGHQKVKHYIAGSIPSNPSSSAKRARGFLRWPREAT